MTTRNKVDLSQVPDDQLNAEVKRRTVETRLKRYRDACQKLRQAEALFDDRLAYALKGDDSEAASSVARNLIEEIERLANFFTESRSEINE